MSGPKLDYFISDSQEELEMAFKKLIQSGVPFAICTCRSGLAIDAAIDRSVEYLNIENSSRFSYTSDNQNSLLKAAEEALEKIGKR